MNFDEIIKQVKSGNVAPVYLLSGEEPYFIDALSDIMEESVLSEQEKSFDQIVVYGKDVNGRQILDEVMQYPMMARKKCVIVREAQDVKDLDALLPCVEKPVSHSVLILCYKYKKLDKRTKVAKAFEHQAVVFESKALYDNQVPAWIVQFVRNKGFICDNAAAELLAEYIGTELTKVSNELEKLLISLPPGGKVTVDMVTENIGISKEYNIFEFQKAIAVKDFAKASRIIDYFVQNTKLNPVIPSVSSLFNYFYKVLIVKYHSKENDAGLMRLLGLGNMYFVKEYREAARNYSLGHLKKILSVLKMSDLKSKGIGGSNDDAVIYKDLFFQIMYEEAVDTAL
jgi:DNA polymerase-3 subunit delta